LVYIVYSTLVQKSGEKAIQTGPSEIETEPAAPTRVTSHATPTSRTDPRRGPAGPAAEVGLGPLVHAPSWPSPRSPRATHARAASRRPRRSANRAPPYAPHAARPCYVHAATTVVVLCTKASSTAIKELELSLLRAYVSPPPGLLCRRAPLKDTAELFAPLAFRTNARPYPFPVAPLKLPRPLVAQAELQARRSTRPRGHHCCPSVLTARSTSGRFSPQTRAAPASLLH
jgi:hypothetical protein